jgi:Cyclin-dependent kinase inhibitor 3 (CDKN3)
MRVRSAAPRAEEGLAVGSWTREASPRSALAPAAILSRVNDVEMPPVGHPLQLIHPVLPARARLWGAGRPSYPDEPPQVGAVEAGVRAWRASGVGLVLSLIEDWEVPRRAPGLFQALAQQGILLRRYPIPDFGVPRELTEFGRLVQEVGTHLEVGDGVLVHCNAGLGRTAVVLAAILTAHGLGGDPVRELRRAYRATAMQEPVQEDFVRSFRAG